MAIAQPELGAQRAGIGDLGAGHGRRHRGHRVGPRAEGVDRDLQQERRVDAAGERDHDAGQGGQVGLKGAVARGEIGHLIGVTRARRPAKTSALTPSA
jgi:hypothetical protein